MHVLNASPVKFSSVREDFEEFMLRCILTVELRPGYFPTDLEKVTFMVLHLTGAALRRVADRWGPHDLVYQSFPTFLAKLREMFAPEPVQLRSAIPDPIQFHSVTPEPVQFRSVTPEPVPSRSITPEPVQFRFVATEPVQFTLRQRDSPLEEYVQKFCDLCDRTGLDDVALKDIFRRGLDDVSIRRLLPGGEISWSLAKYIDTALLLSGSSFTVGPVD
ncbi:MAG: hypothetical protein ACRC4N_04845, partial [Gammaproteobacteria bacterium]